MSSVVEAIYELKYNPFKYGEYIASFYTSVEEQEHNLLLSQLIIPLCSHSIFGSKLLKSNVNSTIWSIFGDQKQLYDLQERIDEFQGLTQQSIQYCIDNDWLSVNVQNLILRSCVDTRPPYNIQRVAWKLGRLFKKHSVVEIYSFLGVKPR
ncbi:three component ABC system middle component [Acinetobacter sp. HR7]|uniref:three component ABC system middle component n=1 Tax=Acinetobacter sp. HR7 TaxID=1509403 RepID=UPI000554D24B|nr:three component ABC system middle component [Acinetobacter sp. HR7]